MRISDWSSDVCSSDLTRRNIQSLPLAERCRLSQVNSLTSFCDHWCKLITLGSSSQSSFEYSSIIRMFDGRSLPKSPFQPREKSFELMKIRLSIALSFGAMHSKIGSASCRDRVCQYV